MKRLLLLLLVVLACGASYVIGTLSGSRTIELPPAEWAAGSPAAEAWRQFLASLEAAGARIYRETADPGARAKGISHLAQLASASLEMKLAKGDPASPAFTDWMSDYRKFLGDSPDAVYATAEISADHQYWISGNVGEAGYLGFMLYGRSINGWNRAADNISLEEMTLSEAGDFSLLLSRLRPSGYKGDWLKLDDDIHMVMVRQYFHDRPASREASFSIATVSPTAYRPVVEADVEHGLAQATLFFNETFSGNLALMEMIAKNANSFDTPREYNQEFGGVFYPTHDNTYFGTWYVLEDDQALVVEGVAPDVDYWSASIQNRWMQSLDYRHHQVSLNNHDIDVDEEGRYRLVLSARDPGVGAWLDTAGHPEGLLAIRYQLATDAEPPSMRVVAIADLEKER